MDRFDFTPLFRSTIGFDRLARLVDTASRVHFRKVEAGRDFGAQVEILSGLNGDEAVASNAPDTLVEGQQVAVQHAAGEQKQ